MEAQSSTGKFWLYFFLSFAVMAALFVFKREYVWTPLPLVVTMFAKAMRLL